jgi:hypothetical protein
VMALVFECSLISARAIEFIVGFDRKDPSRKSGYLVCVIHRVACNIVSGRGRRSETIMHGDLWSPLPASSAVWLIMVYCMEQIAGVLLGFPGGGTISRDYCGMHAIFYKPALHSRSVCMPSLNS